MKKVFIVTLLVIGMAGFAQNRRERPSRQQMEQLTPEQRNELQLKKMTLALDLNAKQQEQMSQIIAEQSAKREAMRADRKAKMEAAKADRFAMKNKMLDEQIEMKNKMKGILSPEQFAKWETLKDKNRERIGDWKEKRRDQNRD
jgi:hypothetical protein